MWTGSLAVRLLCRSCSVTAVSHLTSSHICLVPASLGYWSIFQYILFPFPPTILFFVPLWVLFGTSLFFNPHFINIPFSFPLTIFFPCQMNPNAVLIYVLHIDSSLCPNSHLSGSPSLHHCLAECIFNASLSSDQQNVSVYSSEQEIKTE